MSKLPGVVNEDDAEEILIGCLQRLVKRHAGQFKVIRSEWSTEERDLLVRTAIARLFPRLENAPRNERAWASATERALRFLIAANGDEVDPPEQYEH